MFQFGPLFSLTKLCPLLLTFLCLPAHALSVDDLRRQIETEKITSIEELVAKLPAEYLSNYTLAYHSQSLQEASWENPRAILFGHDAKLVLTFNGDLEHSQYDTVELMQFRDDTQSFDLYSLRFENGTAQILENPRVCISCHGDPGQPLWSSYEYNDQGAVHWPGFYGSIHDAPLNDKQEQKAFQQFRVQAEHHPRYRYLVRGDTASSWYPYGHGPMQHRLRPNNRLGNLLARWQARHIAHRILESDFYRERPQIVSAWLLNCPQVEEPTFKNQIEMLFKKFKKRHARKDWLEIASKLHEFDFMMQAMLTDADYRHWNMDLGSEPNRQQFFTGIVELNRLVTAHWLTSLEQNHWLKQYYRPRTNRDLYNTFAENYYQVNVEPGGVGKYYDSIIDYYDESFARQACSKLSISY